MTKKMV